MFSTFNSFLIFLGAAGFWTLIGLPFARRLLPAPLAVFAAPAFGWALHSALALPIHRLIGFTSFSIWAISIAALAGCIAFLWTAPRSQTPFTLAFLAGAMLAASALSLCIAVAIAPKFDGETILLSPAIFDHSKVAMIDEMARLGVPPGNPFYGGQDAPQPLSYYYLWHFSAAELVLAAGINGWEADAAMTAFSAYSSVMLMMGLSVWLSGSNAAACWVPLLALAGSIRNAVGILAGKQALYSSFIWPGSGLAGWFFQATWVPQHIASATCVVIAIILLAQLARKPGPLLLLTLVLIVVAGYESSTWVGGVTFAIGAAVAGVALLATMPPRDRLRFIAWSAAGAVLALALAAPFLADQYAASAARGVGAPIALHHYDILGESIPEKWRWFLDIPAYWLIHLAVEFPAIYPAGLIVLVAMLRTKTADTTLRAAMAALTAMTIASLVTAWLLVSTLAQNNDLGWRAVLPAIIILTAFTAAGLSRWISARAMLPAAAALIALTLGLPDSVLNLRENMLGRPNQSGVAFSQQSPFWARVRTHAAPDERIANNTLAFQDMTPWPVNIAWALLSSRRSCFAGYELVLAYAPLTKSQRDAADQLFIRLFDGTASPSDVRDSAEKYRCRVIVVTPQDGAWTKDPFSNNPYYGLAEDQAGAWRIYRATGAK